MTEKDLSSRVAKILAQRNIKNADAVARDLVSDLQRENLYLMYWPEKRAPARTSLTSITPAGPIQLNGADLDGMGIRFTIEASLTGAAMILNLPYQNAGMLGSWLVARAQIADAREVAKAKWKNRGQTPPKG